MANAESSLFQTLTDDQIRQLAGIHFPEDAVSCVHPAEGGLFNTTYFVEFVSGKRMVLRAGPVNRHLLMLFEENLMNAEAYVYEQCRKAGIPVSQVLALDCTRTHIDRDYMFVEYISSRPMWQISLAQEGMARLYRDTGRYTRMLHGITLKKFGRVSQICAGGGYDTWKEAILGEIADWKKRALPANVFSAETVARIDAVFARHPALFDDITDAHLVHADLWTGNVLVSEDGARVEAIIDADRAMAGDVDFEFASGWMINDVFVEGYGSAPSGERACVIRRKLYELIYHMCDAYVFHCEYNNDQGYKDKCNSVKNALKWLETAQ